MHLFNRTSYHWRYVSYCWFIAYSTFFFIPASSFHIVLDPAGDTKNTGRQLATCYERSVTLQLCETLKEALAKQYPSCTVTITRTAGEARSQEQRAQIANQRHADLFLHISCFEDTAIKPHLMLYYPLPSTLVAYTPTPYTLIPAHKASDINCNVSKEIANFLATHIGKNSLYTVMPSYAMSDARLVGILVPSCTLEFGISRTVTWTSLIDPLSTALITALHKYERSR